MLVEGILDLTEENKKIGYEDWKHTNFCVIFKDKDNKRLVMTFETKEEATIFKAKCEKHTHFDKETGLFS